MYRLLPPLLSLGAGELYFRLQVLESAGRGTRRVRGTPLQPSWETAHAQFSRALDGRSAGQAESYLFHVSWQLAPRIIVPDVELNVDVHDAGTQGRGGRGSHAACRPRAPGPSAEPARLGRTSTAPPHGQASHRSARRGPRGTVAATTTRASAAPSFFLVSACRKWLCVDVTSAHWPMAQSGAPPPARG